MDAHALNGHLEKHLRVGTFPVGIVSLRAGEPLPPKAKRPKKDLGIQVAICQSIGYARRYGWTLAFSGDTEWVENLLPTANGADLFIAECYGFDVDVRYHLNWKTLSANIDRLGAKRLLLTHMNESMLASRALVTDPRVVCAEDGMELDI